MPWESLFKRIIFQKYLGIQYVDCGPPSNSEHYEDPNLNLHLLLNPLGIHPGYLGTRAPQIPSRHPNSHLTWSETSQAALRSSFSNIHSLHVHLHHKNPKSPQPPQQKRQDDKQLRMIFFKSRILRLSFNIQEFRKENAGMLMSAKWYM